SPESAFPPVPAHTLPRLNRTKAPQRRPPASEVRATFARERAPRVRARDSTSRSHSPAPSRRRSLSPLPCPLLHEGEATRLHPNRPSRRRRFRRPPPHARRAFDSEPHASRSSDRPPPQRRDDHDPAALREPRARRLPSTPPNSAPPRRSHG